MLSSFLATKLVKGAFLNVDKKNCLFKLKRQPKTPSTKNVQGRCFTYPLKEGLLPNKEQLAGIPIQE
jgi:hypothetical protein